MFKSLNGEAITNHNSCHETIKGRMNVNQLECRAKPRDVRNDNAHYHGAKCGQYQGPRSTALQEGPTLCPQHMHDEGLQTIPLSSKDTMLIAIEACEVCMLSMTQQREYIKIWG